MRRFYGWLWVKLPNGGGRRVSAWLIRKALWVKCPVCHGVGWNHHAPVSGELWKWYACGWCWSTGYHYRGSSVGKPRPRPRL